MKFKPKTEEDAAAFAIMISPILLIDYRNPGRFVAVCESHLGGVLGVDPSTGMLLRETVVAHLECEMIEVPPEALHDHPRRLPIEEWSSKQIAEQLERYETGVRLGGGPLEHVDGDEVIDAAIGALMDHHWS